MKSRALVAFLVLSLTVISSANAAAPLGPPPTVKSTFTNVKGQLVKKISFGRGCDGHTDYPHESTHFPLTVNVEALTECPGQEVSITTTISRSRWWIFNEAKSVSAKGFQRVKVNVSLPCKWKIGQPPILYVVISHHSDSKGAQQNTETKARIKC